MQVVVITDVDETRRRLRRILRGLGTTFAVVRTPQEAEAAMALEMPEAIVIDLPWALASGWVLGKWIYKHVPDDVRLILSEETPLVAGLRVWPLLRRATFLPYVWEAEEVADAVGWTERAQVRGEVA
jgi:DNA-binding response OmpR family regulator